MKRKAGYRVIKLTLLMKLPPENPGGRVADMRDSGGELFCKSFCCFDIAGERFGRKGYGLIGRSFGTFPIKEFDYAL